MNESRTIREFLPGYRCKAWWSLFFPDEYFEENYFDPIQWQQVIKLK